MLIPEEEVEAEDDCVLLVKIAKLLDDVGEETLLIDEIAARVVAVDEPEDLELDAREDP